MLQMSTQATCTHCAVTAACENLLMQVPCKLASVVQLHRLPGSSRSQTAATTSGVTSRLLLLPSMQGALPPSQAPCCCSCCCCSA